MLCWVSQNASELLGGHGVDVQVRDREWAAKQGMGAFLAVAQGSLEAPVFLEITYNASAQEKPVTIVGTDPIDSGLCLLF